MLSQLLASEEKVNEEAVGPDSSGPGDPARVGQAPPQEGGDGWPAAARGERGTAAATAAVAGSAGAASGDISTPLSWEADELLWKGDFNALGLESTDDDEELEAELLQRLAAANAGSQRVRKSDMLSVWGDKSVRYSAVPGGS